VRKVKEKYSVPDIEDIISKFKPIISFRVMRSLGTQRPDWEDVVNEIVTNIIVKLKKGEFRGDSSIGTFIYTITSRRIVDFIRQKNKVLKYAPEPEPFPAPYEYIEKKERVDLISQAIKKLRPKHKKVLYYYYYEELTREEIAEKLGLSPRKVTDLIIYARNALKKFI